jgi:Raf kinase inhibitor-like YbhB/YbcL family protein
MELRMRRTVLLLILLILPSTAFATWSVIAVDRSSGRVVIASATCVNQNDQFLMGVQAVVVPGKGVAACQASVDGTHANQMLVFQELQKGTDPKQIIELLSKDPAFQSRQFGILDLQGRRAGHSGLTNGYVAQDMQAQTPGTEIFYSIQGNILRPGQVVPNAVQAFLHNTGTITDRVMAAMEAADGSGGDSRCTCPPWPTDGSKPAIPCDGKTAHVAYILMAEKTDTNGDSHNNGTYTMYLTVSQPGPDRGPNAIREGENLNPVKTLRMRYDEWRKTQRAMHVSPQPSPAAAAAAAAQAAQRGAQPPSAPGASGAPGGPGGPGGRGGRGGGRGGVQVMTLATSAWPDGGPIPLKYAQGGGEVSPALTWTNVPDGTTSFALLVHDQDAATGAGTDDLVHWMLWNVPADARALQEGVPQGSQLADGTRQISATGPSYRGPGAPASGPAHHYVFELYALDTMLAVPSVGASPAETRAAVLAAMAGHVRGKAVYSGVFKR